MRTKATPEIIQHLRDLTHDPKNARRHNPRNIGVIERSLNEVGAARSIVIDEDGVILAGNATTEAAAQAAAQAGIERVRVVEADGNELIAVMRRGLTAEQKVKLALADNRSAELAEWEPGVLAELAGEFDLSALFTADELTDLAQPNLPEAGAGGDEYEDEGGETRAQAGDLWIIGGKHRLLVGDCTDAANVARLMGGERAAFEFTDPPYELETVGGGLLKEAAHMRAIEDANIDTFDPDRLTLQTPTAVFCCNKPLVPAYIALAERLKVGWDICFYWKENTTPNYGGHMMTDVEYLMLLGHQGPISGQEKELYSKGYRGGLDIGSDVAWQKPIELVEKYIRLYSKPGAIVLDRFAGTGTTMIAAQRQGRKAYCFELLPRMADVILRRAEAEGLTVERAE